MLKIAKRVVGKCGKKERKRERRKEKRKKEEKERESIISKEKHQITSLRYTVVFCEQIKECKNHKSTVLGTPTSRDGNKKEGLGTVSAWKIEGESHVVKL